MSHTPGPWEVDDRGNILHRGNLLIVSNCTGIHAAPTADFDAYTKEVEANAHLIAAAPEMYEALSAFTREAESWHAMHHNNPTTQCDAICNAIPAAKAALAKAEGK